jgi:hypothetical protein
LRGRTATSAITTATIVGISAAAASAGSTIYAAKKASGAAKEAAATQSAAADKALAAQKQGYDQQRQDFSPYQQAGAAALGRLGQTAGTYTGGVPQPGPPPQMPQPSQGGLGSLGQPSMGNPSPMGGGPAPGSPQMPPQGAPGGLVQVQAPTGEMAMLSPQAAQQAVAKGAKLVQGGPPSPGGMPPQGQV